LRTDFGSCNVANDNQEVAIENQEVAIEYQEVAIENQEVAIESLKTLKVKPGVNLPRSNNNWNEANNYFKSLLSLLLKLQQTRLMKQYSL